MPRKQLTDRVVERIRRERYDPSPTQCDYIHLADLRRGLRRALDALPTVDGPALDLYCGTQPYRALIPRRPLWGLDIDRHFGRADVVGRLPLPFRDEAFSLVVCTQALHFVDDPRATVNEMRRVLRPGGYAVVSVPYAIRRETSDERRLSDADLRTLFAGWHVRDLAPVGGIGSEVAFLPGSLALSAARHWPRLRVVLPPVGLTLTVIGKAIDLALWPLASRWPAVWVMVAERPAD